MRMWDGRSKVEYPVPISPCAQYVRCLSPTYGHMYLFLDGAAAEDVVAQVVDY